MFKTNRLYSQFKKGALALLVKLFQVPPASLEPQAAKFLIKCGLLVAVAANF